jgi:hypothetical protein
MDDCSASMLELKAVRCTGNTTSPSSAVVRRAVDRAQIKRQRPDTRVLVTDKRTEPAPDAAFKVGESSVEVGAQYREVVGMRDHLEQMQLRKLGLRRCPPETTATSRSESSSALRRIQASHQIDRGRFENSSSGAA